MLIGDTYSDSTRVSDTSPEENQLLLGDGLRSCLRWSALGWSTLGDSVLSFLGRLGGRRTLGGSGGLGSHDGNIGLGLT